VTAKGPDSNLGAYAAVALLGQLGLTVALPIILCAVAGKYLDAWLHTHGVLLLVLLVFGIAAGGYGAYRLLAKDLNWKP
jgi:ATP synthase protein I